MHYDQVEYISEMQSWFNIQNSINVIIHFSEQKI